MTWYEYEAAWQWLSSLEAETWVNLFLAAVAVVAALISYSQTNLMRDQFERENRPFLAAGPIGQVVFKPGVNISYEFSIKNVGKVPVNIFYLTDYIAVQEKFDEKFLLSEIPHKGLIRPEAESVIAASDYMSFGFALPSAPAADEHANWVAGKKHLFLVVEMRYHSVISEERKRRFLMIFEFLSKPTGIGYPRRIINEYITAK